MLFDPGPVDTSPENFKTGKRLLIENIFERGISWLHAQSQTVCHLSASCTYTHRHTHTNTVEQINPLADLFHQRWFREDDWQAWFVICMALGFIRCYRCRNLSTDEWTPLLAQMHWIFRLCSFFPLIFFRNAPSTSRSYSKARTHFNRALLTGRFVLRIFLFI